MFLLAETNEIYGLIGILIGAVSGVVITWIRVNGIEKDSTKRLKREIEEIKIKMEVLKVGFSIIYDQYERDFHDSPEKISMLKDFKRLIDS